MTFFPSNRASLLYSTLLTFVLGWWVLAFQDSFWKSDVHLDLKTLPIELASSSEPQKLSSLNRNLLITALQGNFPLMAKKILEWDVDASILEASGIKNIHRLSPHLILRSHYLLRIIKTLPTLPLKPLKYLPQTYASAGFLLTLLHPESIAALPSGIRKNTQLYPLKLTSKIPFNLNRFETEKIYLMKPASAFVSAFYSDPVMIQSLQNQGISMVFTPAISTLTDIYDSLLLIGKNVGKSDEAELLSLFIESSLMAIENRLLAAKPLKEWNQIKEMSFYLCYNTHLHTPSPLTVTVDLLNRLDLSMTKKCEEYKGTSLTQEDLLRLNPEFLLISANDPSQIERLLIDYPALKSLEAIRQNNIFWLDDTIQQSPTHHIILAYFDLVNALAHMRVQ